MKFTKKFNFDQKYSVNPKTVFTHEVKCGNQLVWDGSAMIEKVKKQAVKNNAHFVKFSYFKHGGLFDQMPVEKAEGLVPLKKNLPTEKYGGYNKPGVMFYIPVRYKSGKKYIYQPSGRGCGSPCRPEGPFMAGLSCARLSLLYGHNPGQFRLYPRVGIRQRQ